MHGCHHLGTNHFEFGDAGALQLERCGWEAQRRAESLEPLMDRPFGFWFPGTEWPYLPLSSSLRRLSLCLQNRSTKQTAGLSFLVTGVYP